MGNRANRITTEKLPDQLFVEGEFLNLIGGDLPDLIKRITSVDAEHPALVEHHHPIGDREGGVHFVRHDDTRHPELLGQIDDQLIDLRAGDWVQTCRRLVVEKNQRIERQRSREPGTFLHPARDLRRKFVGMLSQSDQLELDLHLDVDDGPIEIRVLFERKRDVFGQRHRLKESAGLEQDSEIASDLVHPLFVQLIDPVPEHRDRAFRRGERADQHPQKRRLPTT